MRPPHRVRAALVAAVLLAGCGGSAVAPVDFNIGPQVTVTHLRSDGLPLTYYSGLTVAQRTVVRDAATWQATWRAIWDRTLPAPALPTIDFTREMVVVAALGERNTGGYAIGIDSAATADSGVVVWVHSTSPGASCGLTQALTQPVDVARLPLLPGPVTFRERAQTVDCR